MDSLEEMKIEVSSIAIKNVLEKGAFSETGAHQDSERYYLKSLGEYMGEIEKGIKSITDLDQDSHYRFESIMLVQNLYHQGKTKAIQIQELKKAEEDFAEYGRLCQELQDTPETVLTNKEKQSKLIKICDGLINFYSHDNNPILGGIPSHPDTDYED